MGENNYVSEAVIRRLPKYLRQLNRLDNDGIERISSKKLSMEMGLNASQIRQDLNCFGGFGQQGYGYHVKSLRKAIMDILGLNQRYKIVIIGAGNIGQALSGYAGFKSKGFDIIGIFDNDPKITGSEINGFKVMDIKDFSAFSAKESIDIGVIATPLESAVSVAEMLHNGGIRAIWNFTPIEVDIEGIFIENVCLNDSLYVLCYRLAEGAAAE